MTRVFPQRAANEITVVLRTVGEHRFPVDVRTVAKEISRAKYPEEPIAVIRGDSLPGFEGALSPAPAGKRGWGIFYNNAISSRGRINFTLGHEFGHYLLHRKLYPEGLQCTAEDMANWQSEYAQRENEANEFAATLLMPFDDFRTQVNASQKPGFEDLRNCAERYDVSLIAAILRWLQYTSRHSMLVVSRDGFVLWARSSKRAFQSGLFYRTRNTSPIEVPEKALAATSRLRNHSLRTLEFDSDVWLGQPGTEHIFVSRQYDFTLSLLHFTDVSHAPEQPETRIKGARN